jgi:putative SOS response-associated peptidase YedK
MCGGFSNTIKAKKWKDRFNISLNQPDPEIRYNARPGQNLPIITNVFPHKFTIAKWGFRAQWMGKGLINARAETITEKPAFKNAFQKRRCLVLADSFYEWHKTPQGSQPYRIVMKNGKPFTMAGIFEPFTDENGEIITTFAIITTNANKIMESIHERMPVIFRQEDELNWIDDNFLHPEKLLHAIDSRCLDAYKISKLINSPSNDTPEVIKPI